MGRGHGKDFHAGGESGLNSDVGVFDDEAAGGGSRDFHSGFEKDVGMGFSPRDVLGTGEAATEKAVESGRGKADLDVFPRGRGPEGKGDSCGGKRFEQSDDSGERCDPIGGKEVAIKFFFAVPERGDGGCLLYTSPSPRD